MFADAEIYYLLSFPCIYIHTQADAVTYWCCWLTVLQSELTSQWEQRRSWHACVDSGGVRLAQRWGWTMVERFPKLCLHWSCLCCTPAPQDTLHSDQALASQLTDRERGKITHMSHGFTIYITCNIWALTDICLCRRKEITAFIYVVMLTVCVAIVCPLS